MSWLKSEVDTRRPAAWTRLGFLGLALGVACAGAAAGQSRPEMDGLEAVAQHAPRSPKSGGVDLIGFGQAADFPSFFKNGWESERDKPDHWTLDKFPGGGAFLVMPSNGDSVQIGHKVGPLDPNQSPMLHLKFRVDKTPPGADIGNKNREDAAFRFFVVFDKKDGILAPNTIGYAWTTSNEPGSFIRSDRSFLGNVWYVVLGKGDAQSGQWLTFDRDVAADYRKAFKISGTVPKIVAVGVKGDTNDTHTSSQAALSEASLGTGK